MSVHRSPPKATRLRSGHPRTRTPRLAPAQRRAQLLDAALDVLSEDGFAAVTIEAVAQRAGVTRPVVYDQFGDLEALMVALIDTAEETALAPLLRIVAVQPGEDADPEQFLFDAVQAFLRAVKADPRTWRLVLMPPRGSSPLLRERIRVSRRLVADHVRALLDWGVPRRGGPFGLDHELAARVLVAAGEDAARLMLAHPRRFTVERLTQVTREFVALVPPGAAERALPRPSLAPPAAATATTTAATSRRMPQSLRREQLLDVTLELISEQGFTGLSMEAVARRAGVNRAVVYRSFANIGTLTLTLLHREDQRVRGALARVIPSSPAGTPAALLAETLTGFLADVIASPQSWGAALLRPESAPLSLQKVVNRRRAALAEQLEPLIRWGVSAPGVSGAERDVEALARMLLSICEELARLVLDDPDFPLERVIAGSWALLDALPDGL